MPRQFFTQAEREQLSSFPPHGSCLSLYGTREKTRTSQLQEIQRHLGWRKSTQMDVILWENWLLERAMEHDRPSLLFQLLCQKLIQEKIIRPAVTTLERMVMKARVEATTETFNRLQFLLNSDTKVFLDSLLTVDETTHRTPLSWLRCHATTNSPNSILKALDKLTFLERLAKSNVIPFLLPLLIITLIF